MPISTDLLSTKTGAALSDCRKYRYLLWRPLMPEPDSILKDDSIGFLMLNPSTADELENDPTIRRCIGFAESWGFGQLFITNIFAFRAADPKLMKAAEDPVGPDNDTYLRRMISEMPVVCAWGTHGKHLNRANVVKEMFRRQGQFPLCLSTTQDGSPGHPLYLPKTLEPAYLR